MRHTYAPRHPFGTVFTMATLRLAISLEANHRPDVEEPRIERPDDRKPGYSILMALCKLDKQRLCKYVLSKPGRGKTQDLY